MVSKTQGTVVAILFVALFGGDLYRAIKPSAASPVEVTLALMVRSDLHQTYGTRVA